jgi:tRNA threonylcarbamoyladenosine biosynthesis protein TsaB
LQILALDTSSAAGSSALIDDERVVVERVGDGSRTHGERLPGELMATLEAAGVDLQAVDRFAVAVGPGSFTGLRVGIASIQGLALASDKLVVPVTTFEALARCTSGENEAVAIWIDAHRGEVFAALFGPDRRATLREPSSLTPTATLDAWDRTLQSIDRIHFAGGGAIRYHDVIRTRLGERAAIEAHVPALAGVIGQIACREPSRAGRPHAIVPLYVRRPDAELARDGRRA